MNYLHRLAFATLLLFPAAAQAHPGDHSGFSGMIAVLGHFLSQPDHALLLIGAVSAGIYLCRKAAARSQDIGDKEF